MDYQTEFIKNLKKYRKENNLTQESLAEMLDYSQKNIAKWEQGASMPSVDVLIKLSKLMNISLDKLLGVEKSIFEKCEDYVAEVEKLDKDVIQCYIASLMDRFVNSILLDMTLKEVLENAISETDKLVVKYLIDNEYITVEGENWVASDELATECFNRYEDLYTEAIAIDRDMVERLESISNNRELTSTEKDSLRVSRSILKENIKLMDEVKKAKEDYFTKI